MDPRIAELVDFWRQVVADDRWLRKDPPFDRSFRERFLAQHMDAHPRRCHDWIEPPAGALAPIVLPTNFPRNAFRAPAPLSATTRLPALFPPHRDTRGPTGR